MEIAKRWKASGNIGNGTFGEVYKGTDKKTGLGVAIKLEGKQNSMLKQEYELMKHFNNIREKNPNEAVGFPEVLYFNDSEYLQRNQMVMELCDQSL